MSKLWGGRFTGAVDPLMEEFNASLRFDKRMYAQDVRGSQAYAEALGKRGLLTPDEVQTLISGLAAVEAEWAAGTFAAQANDEDIHTANERRLGELVGSVAGKLHTGRSRNDQVATDTRLWLADECAKLKKYLEGLIATFTDRAEREMDAVMPGYTHLQRAQPIRWSHFLMMHAWFLQADAERLGQLMERIASLPLGSGALAGNPFKVDRVFLAERLGMPRVMPNSMYAVSDRDFIVEFLFWATLTMNHISRFAEDLVIYSSAEFGFVRLADAYSTGSSLMPQKRNPDSAELLRGKSGRTFGQLAGLLMTLKGLSSTYNKDLQEDKEPLFDAVDTLAGSLQIANGVIATLTINDQRMRDALSYDMLATDLAEYLVRRGVPFRETHHVAGAAVRLAESKGVSMKELSVDELRTLHGEFEPDVLEIWDFERSIEQRDAEGGTSRRAVKAQIELMRAFLSKSA